MLGALVLFLLLAVVVAPSEQAEAYVETAPWVVLAWDDPAYWSGIETLLHYGEYGGGNLENSLRPVYESQLKNTNALLMEDGINAGRVSWASKTAPIAARWSVYGSALLAGIVVGSSLNKHFLHLQQRISGEITGGTITDVAITTSQAQTLGPWQGTERTGTIWHIGFWCGTSGMHTAFSSGSTPTSNCTFLSAAHVTALLTLVPDVGVELAPYTYGDYYIQLPWLPNPDELKTDIGIEPWTGQQSEANLPWVWPEYESEAGEEIRASIAAHPTLTDELNHQLNPEYEGNPTPSPMNPGGDPESGQPPYDPPSDDPIVAPPATGVSCPMPLATDIDFGPLQRSGLQDKFPFGVFAWLHTTLSGWAGTAQAPEFDFEVMGHSQHVSLSVANGAMAILRTVMLALSGLGMVWWMATALLGMRGE